MKEYMVCFGYLNDSGDVCSKGDGYQDVIVWPRTLGAVVNHPVIRGITPGQQGGCYVDSEKSDIWIVVSYTDSLKRESITEVSSCVVEYISYRNSPTNVTQWLRERFVTAPIYRGAIHQNGGRGYVEVGANGKCFVPEGIAEAGSDGSATVGFGIAKTGLSGVARTLHAGIAIGAANAQVHAENMDGIAIGDGSAKCHSGDYGISKTNDGEAITGECGIALSGERGVVQAGVDGLLIVRSFNTEHIYQVAQVGVKGIKPNVPYRADEWGFYDPKAKSAHFLRVLRYYWNKLVSFFLI